MQEKTSILSTYARQVGLNINITKTEVMTFNTPNPQPIKIDEKDLPMTEQFKYLGSIVKYDGGAGVDIQSWLNKARNSLKKFNDAWRLSQYATHTKLKIYQSCVNLIFCRSQGAGKRR